MGVLGWVYPEGYPRIVPLTAIRLLLLILPQVLVKDPALRGNPSGDCYSAFSADSSQLHAKQSHFLSTISIIS